MFSLRMILAAVAVVTVYVAAMVYHTRGWETAIATLTFVIYGGAMTAAVLSHKNRAFFVAFSIFGLVYALSWYAGIANRLVTERMFDNLVERIAAVQKEAMQLTEQEPPLTRADAISRGLAYQPFDDWITRLKFIGRCSFSVFVGLLAGFVAEAVVRRSKANLPTVVK